MRTDEVVRKESRLRTSAPARRRKRVTKIALTALVQLCKREQVRMIDCQQNTRHLAFMGAAEVPRRDFLDQVRVQTEQPAMRWEFAASDWADIIPLSEMTFPHTAHTDE